MHALRNTILSICLLLATPTSGQTEHRSLTITHTFDSMPNQPRRFPVLIDTPEHFDPDTNYAVVLFHGGLQTDPHWTVPGTYHTDGHNQPLTLDSKDTTDADTLASTLLDAGYAVVRYGSIHLDDQLHAQNPALAEPITYPQTVQLADRVWITALEELDINPDRCIALAHSLGAPRAVHASTDSGAAGYIFLAGAYLSPTMTSPRSLCRNAEHLDTPAPDTDASGSIDPFERAAHHAIDTNTSRSDERFTNNGHTYPWASDTLLQTDAPILAIWGSLDPTSYHGPLLTHLFQQAHQQARLTSHYALDRGHNLSAEKNGLIGPIDPQVVQTVTEWIRSHFPS